MGNVVKLDALKKEKKELMLSAVCWEEGGEVEFLGLNKLHALVQCMSQFRQALLLPLSHGSQRARVALLALDLRAKRISLRAGRYLNPRLSWC